MSRDKCYILVSPDVPLALCQTPSLKAATVEVDRYREYGHSLDHILPSSHLLALAYNDGATLYLNDGISTSNIVLDSCQYWNLFHGSTVCVKLKPYPIPKPVYATTVSVALVRSGNFSSLRFYRTLANLLLVTQDSYPWTGDSCKYPAKYPKINKFRGIPTLRFKKCTVYNGHVHRAF